MDKLYADIGARMRALRKALRLTQSQVAEIACIDASFYGQLERGANVPSLKTFLAVARALNASPSDLLPAQKDPGDSRFGGAITKMISRISPKDRDVAMGVVSDVLGRFRKRG